MLKNVFQVPMANIALVPLMFLSFLVFIIPIAVLWKRGKIIEALLVWNSMLLYIIALILLLK